jgi:hypothetical protein
VGLPITEPDVSNLRPLIESIDYESLLGNLATYREKLSLRKNVPRLVSLYRAVAPSVGPLPDRNDADAS